MTTALEPAYVPYTTAEAARTEEWSLSGVLHVLRRRRRVILAVGAIVALIIAAIILTQPRVYQATALVMIDPREEQVVDPDQRFTKLPANAPYVDSEVEALNSRSLAARLANDMQLGASPYWNPDRPENGSTGVTSAVIDRVAAAIEAERRGLTNVIEINVRANDPEEAASVANRAFEAYLLEQRQMSVTSARDADEWLSGRLSELAMELERKETALERYRAETGIMNVEGGTLNEQQVDNSQAAMLAARGDVAERDARLRQVQRLREQGASAEAIANVINSETIRDLRIREADIARRQADMEARYGERHPALQNVRAERADMQRQIDAEVGRIAANLAAEAEVSRSRLAALEAQFAQTRRQLQGDGAQLPELNQLEREVEAARAVYQSFLERSHEISQQGYIAPSARLLSPADPPSSPENPGLIAVLLLAGAAGLIAGVIAALLVEQLDDRLLGADDVAEKIGISAVASIPVMPQKALNRLGDNERHPAGYLASNPFSAFAEAFRVLRASIVYSRDHERRKVVAFTSALPSEGKTTVALCVARIAALSGERVVLLDCDTRRKSLNDMLNVAPHAGLVEVLNGECDWRNVVGRDEPSGAHVIPLSTGNAPLADVFGSASMRKLVDALSTEYDLVILDCAPILAVAETRPLVGLADAVILVSRWGKTRASALASAVAQIEATGASVSGVALNFVDPREPGRTSTSDSLYYVDAKKGYYTAV